MQEKFCPACRQGFAPSEELIICRLCGQGYPSPLLGEDRGLYYPGVPGTAGTEGCSGPGRPL